MVMVRPEMASCCVRSRSGIMWPCAGNGMTSTCLSLTGFPMFEVCVAGGVKKKREKEGLLIFL